MFILSFYVPIINICIVTDSSLEVDSTGFFTLLF